MHSYVDDFFWNAVQLSIKNPKGFSRMLKKRMTRGGLGRFYLGYQEAALEMIGTDPWYSMATAANPQLISEDGSEDFCYWIVGQGKQFYNHIIHDPDAIAKVARDYYRDLKITPFFNLAVDEYLKRYSGELPQLM